ncbi:hypothetical protein F5Y15DRAFT_246159 [Xylariaceae sp. FL0016]|nr:hypothetical protein F5Y15DRAFT_246159 [Xylariaceae sp. FL0016]
MPATLLPKHPICNASLPMLLLFWYLCCTIENLCTWISVPLRQRALRKCFFWPQSSTQAYNIMTEFIANYRDSA